MAFGIPDFNFDIIFSFATAVVDQHLDREGAGRGHRIEGGNDGKIGNTGVVFEEDERVAIETCGYVVVLEEGSLGAVERFDCEGVLLSVFQEFIELEFVPMARIV